MRKETYPINISYSYYPEKMYTKYTFDGKKFYNGGDFHEIVTKSVLGFKPEKDGNTKYDVESDIPELRASVKSSKFTLVNEVLADSFEKSLDVYFKNVHSTLFIYAVAIDDMITLYYMDATEFRVFLTEFSKIASDSGYVRGKSTTGKMLRWLEARLK